MSVDAHNYTVDICYLHLAEKKVHLFPFIQHMFIECLLCARDTAVKNKSEHASIKAFGLMELIFY